MMLHIHFEATLLQRLVYPFFFIKSRKRELFFAFAAKINFSDTGTFSKIIFDHMQVFKKHIRTYITATVVTLTDVPKFSDDDLWKWWWWHFWWYWFSSWWKVTDARISADTFIFFSWHLFDKSNFVAWVISVLKWKRLPYKNVFFSNKYFFHSETNMTTFFVQKKFSEKNELF